MSDASNSAIASAKNVLRQRIFIPPLSDCDASNYSSD
jgi:hypothetical protein